MRGKHSTSIKMKTKYIDLHTHTMYSDGQLTPKQVVRFSALNGNDILAISDHDNSKGYLEAKETAKEYGIKLISGAEITTPNYHLLALNFDPKDKTFQNFLRHSRRLQRVRCEERVKILKEEGVPITMGKIKRIYPYSRLGKGNILEIFCSDHECRKYFKEKNPSLSPSEIFQYYLGKGGVAGHLRPKAGVSPKEAIKAVHEAGGIIGIAHPPKDIKKMQELEILVEQGIDFIEIQPNYKAKYPYYKFETFAKENNIPLSYGSDYHGPTLGRELLGRGENILSQAMEKLLNIP